MNASQPRFSFRYGNQPSAEFIHRWPLSENRQEQTSRVILTRKSSDPSTGLECEMTLTSWRNVPAFDWVLRLVNRGSTDTPIIAEILPLDITLPYSSDKTAVLHHAKGSACSPDDFQPLTTPIAPGERTPRNYSFRSIGGRSSDGVLPFMNLQKDSGGLVIGIGWTGQWQASFVRGQDSLRIAAGMERTHLILHPGESIRTPRILLMEWEGADPVAGNNLLRNLLLEHYLPRRNGELILPPVARMRMSSIYFNKTIGEEYELASLETFAETGVEAYWIDACWYGSGKDWAAEVGNWQINRRAFPRGLKPISEAAHKKGMKFVVWFEPERARAESTLAAEHPEFLLKSQDNSAYLLFNLGMPEAREYMTDLISSVIAESGIDVYRQDFNFQPLPYWQAHDSPDRIGMTEIRHIEGLYLMWDELVRRHPGLAIDNCASGGRRIDLETLSRSLPLWRSDFSDICGLPYGQGLHVGNQFQGAALSRWVPLHTAGVYEWTPYDFRSVMSAGIVLYAIEKKEPFLLDNARRAVSELKRLRPYFLGDFYPLLPLTIASHDWCAYQYDRPDMAAGCAFFFRRHESPFPAMDAQLRAIDQAADYRVTTAGTFDWPPHVRMTGRELRHRTITIAEQPGSLLLVYEKE